MISFNKYSINSANRKKPCDLKESRSKISLTFTKSSFRILLCRTLYPKKLFHTLNHRVNSGSYKKCFQIFFNLLSQIKLMSILMTEKQWMSNQNCKPIAFSNNSNLQRGSLIFRVDHICLILFSCAQNMNRHKVVRIVVKCFGAYMLYNIFDIVKKEVVLEKARIIKE